MRYIGYILGALWSLPITLVTLLLAIVYRPEACRWSGGCIELVAGKKLDKHGQLRTRIWGNPDGQSIGGLVIWYDDESSWNNSWLRVHERRHSFWGMVLSIVFWIAYGVDFVWHFAFLPDRGELPAEWKRWQVAYWHMWLERDAREYADKHPDGWGHLG